MSHGRPAALQPRYGKSRRSSSASDVSSPKTASPTSFSPPAASSSASPPAAAAAPLATAGYPHAEPTSHRTSDPSQGRAFRIHPPTYPGSLHRVNPDEDDTTASHGSIMPGSQQNSTASVSSSSLDATTVPCFTRPGDPVAAPPIPEHALASRPPARLRAVPSPSVVDAAPPALALTPASSQSSVDPDTPVVPSRGLTSTTPQHLSTAFCGASLTSSGKSEVGSVTISPTSSRARSPPPPPPTARNTPMASVVFRPPRSPGGGSPRHRRHQSAQHARGPSSLAAAAATAVAMSTAPISSATSTSTATATSPATATATAASAALSSAASGPQPPDAGNGWGVDMAPPTSPHHRRHMSAPAVSSSSPSTTAPAASPPPGISPQGDEDPPNAGAGASPPPSLSTKGPRPTFPVRDPMLGRSLSTSYTLIVANKLGSGGFGTVYRAGTHIEKGELAGFVAVKVAKMDGLSHPQQLRRQSQLADEAEKLEAIPPHPNVLTIVTIVKSARYGTLIVLPLAQYGDLWAWLRYCRRHAQLTVRRRLKVLLQVLAGLDHLHELALVHQDLKPGNVLLFSGDVAKVADFGLLGGMDDTPSELTAAARGGTPLYASPEQAAGTNVTPKADMWSFGVLAYQVCTFNTPNHTSLQDLKACDGGNEVQEFVSGQLAAWADPDPWRLAVRSVIQQCLTIDPAGRPSSRDAIATIQAACAGTPDLSDMATAAANTPPGTGDRADLLIRRARWARVNGQPARAASLLETLLASPSRTDSLGPVLRREHAAVVAHVDADRALELWTAVVVEAAADHAVLNVVESACSLVTVPAVLRGVLALPAAVRALQDTAPARHLSILMASIRVAQTHHDPAVPLVVFDALPGADARRAVVTATSAAGMTVMHAAVEAGLPALFPVFVEHGAQVDARRVSDGITPLWLACQTGRAPVVKALLVLGPNLRLRRYRDGATPLFIAAANGHSVVVQDLLKAFDHLHPDAPARYWQMATNDDGTEPLWIAAQYGYADVVTVLLQAGADRTRGRWSDGTSPLFIASQQGHLAVVETLLTSPSPDASSAVSMTVSASVYGSVMPPPPLAWPLQLPSPLSSPLPSPLPSPPVSPSQPVLPRRRPPPPSAVPSRPGPHLPSASSSPSPSVPTLSDSSPITPLVVAVSHGFADVVAALLEAGADPNTVAAAESAPVLWVACRKGYTAVVELLLYYDAALPAVRRVREHHTSALWAAASRGHNAVCGVLLEAGAVGFEPDDASASPLHAAAVYGHLDTLNTLVAGLGSGVGPCANALLRSGPHAGYTAVHMAAYKGHSRVLEALLEPEVGWDRRRLYRDGSVPSPLELACGRGHIESVVLLLQAMREEEEEEEEEAKAAVPAQAVVAAARGGHVAVLNMLVVDDAPLVAASSPEERWWPAPEWDEYGWDAVVAAAGGGHANAVGWLLDRALDGPTMSVVPPAGYPTFAAARGGHTAVLQDLLSRGVVPISPTDPLNGETLLSVAAGSHRTGTVDVLLGMSWSDAALVAAVAAATQVAAAHPRTVRVLLAHPTVIRCISKDPRVVAGVMAHACRMGLVEIVLVLVTQMGFDVATPLPSTAGTSSALEVACRSGQLDVVRVLLDSGGATPCQRDVIAAASYGDPHVFDMVAASMTSAELAECLAACEVGKEEEEDAEEDAAREDGDGEGEGEADEGGEETKDQGGRLRDSLAASDTTSAAARAFLAIRTEATDVIARLPPAVSFPSALSLLSVACHYGAVDPIRTVLQLPSQPSPADDDSAPLYHAAMAGKEDAVLLLLTAPVGPADPVRGFRGGNRPMYAAAANNHLPVVKLLADYSSNNVLAAVNALAPSPHRKSALITAAEAGHTDVVDALLGAGAAVNWVTVDTGMSALWAACRWGHSGVVRLLLTAGADVNTTLTTAARETALWVAAKHGHADVVGQLVDAKASLDTATASDGFTPLFVASQNGHVDVVNRLVAAGAASDRCATADGASPLWVASFLGKLDVVRSLVACGADVTRPTTDGAHPLFVACMRGHADVAEFLLEHGAGVDDPKASTGSTPCFIAAQENHAHVLDLLFRNGADPNLKNDEEGAAPLVIAVQRRCAAAVERLLAHPHIDVNTQTKNGRGTPLFFAVAVGGAVVTRALLQAGADPTLQLSFDGNMLTPIDLARSQGSQQVVDALEAAMAARVARGGV